MEKEKEQQTVKIVINTSEAPAESWKDSNSDHGKVSLPKGPMFVLWLSWACVFAAYSALENLQSSLHTNSGLGVLSVTLVYFCKALSSTQGSTLVTYMTPKWSLVFGFLCHLTYILANLYPSPYTLLPSAVLLGLATGPLWIAFGLYITVLGLRYAKLSGQTPSNVLSRFNGWLNMSNPTSYVIGNFISASVLKYVVFDSNAETSVARNDSQLLLQVVQPMNVSDQPELLLNSTNFDKTELNSAELCGPDSCPPQISLAESFQNASMDISIDIRQLYCLVAILAFVNISGILTTVFFLQNLTKSDVKREKDNLEVKTVDKQVSTSKMNSGLTYGYLYRLPDWKLCLLVPFICYIYFAMALVGAMFTKVYVSCYLTIGLIGYMSVFRGVIGSITNILSGTLGQCLHRNYQFAFAAGLACAMATCWLLWEQVTDWISPTILVFAIGAASGALNAINLIHFSAFLGTTFPHKKTSAFAFYHTISGLAMGGGFLMSNYLCARTQIYILLFTIILTVLTYGPLTAYQTWHSSNSDSTRIVLTEHLLPRTSSDNDQVESAPWESMPIYQKSFNSPSSRQKTGSRLKTPINILLEENLASSQLSLANI